MKGLKKVITVLFILIFCSCSLQVNQFTGYWYATESDNNNTTRWNFLFDTSTFVYVKSVTEGTIITDTVAEGTYYYTNVLLFLNFEKINGAEKSRLQTVNYSFSADNSELTLILDKKNLTFSRP